jgi:hypothetical protein
MQRAETPDVVRHVREKLMNKPNEMHTYDPHMLAGTDTAVSYDAPDFFRVPGVSAISRYGGDVQVFTGKMSLPRTPPPVDALSSAMGSAFAK